MPRPHGGASSALAARIYGLRHLDLRQARASARVHDVLQARVDRAGDDLRGHHHLRQALAATAVGVLARAGMYINRRFYQGKTIMYEAALISPEIPLTYKALVAHGGNRTWQTIRGSRLARSWRTFARHARAELDSELPQGLPLLAADLRRGEDHFNGHPARRRAVGIAGRRGQRPISCRTPRSRAAWFARSSHR